MDGYEDYLHDIEEIAEWEELEMKMKRRPVRTDPFQQHSDEYFLCQYGLTKVCAKELLGKISEKLKSSYNGRGSPIPHSLQLLVTLRYLKTGNFQMTLSDVTDLSQASVSRCLKTVSSAIAELAPELITFPEVRDEEQVMRRFSGVTEMPGVIGVMDGCLIPVKNPGGTDSEVYRCKENLFAINVMGVCDASLQFTQIEVDNPGSAHDSDIFASSSLRQKLESAAYCGHLLGDCAYPCRPYLLTPLPKPYTEKEKRYNDLHNKTWGLIRQTFDLWRRRFGVLSSTNRTNLPTTRNIIVACAVLHNIAVENSLPLRDEQNVLEEDQKDYFMVQVDSPEGQVKRAKIVDGL